MTKTKVLVWETLATVSGGQKITLTVLDLLAEQYTFCCMIPAEGMFSEELKKRNIPYVIMGDQTLPTGVKGRQVIFRYGWMSVMNIVKSLKVMIRYKPQILYCPGPAALPWSAVCGSLAGKPVIWHLHHIFLDGATKKLLNICGRWISVQTILGVSHCVGDQIENKTAHRKVRVLYNPVDAAKYASGNPDRVLDEVEKCLGRRIAEDEQSLVIGHVALIQHSKKQGFTLALVKALRDRGYDAMGVFAGECREPEYMVKLTREKKKLGLDNQVAFLGRRNDIPDLLKMLDVLIIPSSFEGFPLAGLEAAAAGLPVAACNEAGAKEFIQASGDGICFTEDDIADAVKAIEAIRMRKTEMEKNGKSFAAKMTVAEYAANILKQFQQAVQNE